MTLEKFRALAKDDSTVYVMDADGRVELRLRSVYRAFAAWFPAGDQPGLHVRSVDAAAVRSTGFRGPDHNWIYVATLDGAEVPALVAESKRLCAMRGGGRTSVAVELYRPLAAALKLVSQRPDLLHAGGPRAKVMSGEQPLAVALARACKERTLHLRRPGDDETLAQIAKLFANVRNEVWWPVANVARYSTGREMRLAEDQESAPVQCARAELGCFHSGSQKCMPYATKAVVRAIRDLDAERAEHAHAFAIELDDLVLRHELSAAYGKYMKAEPPAFERVLWRAGDAKSFPAWWIARIEPGTYGFLAKLGGRWGWHVSDRDNTLATVPDELLDAAAEMTLARDR